MRIGGRDYSRRELERRVGNITQLGGTRHVELADGRSRGVRAVEFDTGCGLRFSVLPERGMDIADFSYRGPSLVYHTPGTIAHPAFFDPAGMEWLRTFFGGLLTTCGPTYFGNPGKDGEEELGLHGRYSALPASRVCDLSRREADEYVLELTGCVEEAAPFTILYHVNTGFPLLGDKSELVSGSKVVEPYDEVSRARLDEVARFEAPQAGFPNLDYLHTMAPDEEGYAWAAMVNRVLDGGLGLALRFHTSTLPFLNEWKMLSEVDHVVGLEPVNTVILNRAELRRRKRLPRLEPGERRSMEVRFTVLEGQGEIGDFEVKVKSILDGE